MQAREREHPHDGIDAGAPIAAILLQNLPVRGHGAILPSSGPPGDYRADVPLESPNPARRFHHSRRGLAAQKAKIASRCPAMMSGM